MDYTTEHDREQHCMPINADRAALVIHSDSVADSKTHAVGVTQDGIPACLEKSPSMLRSAWQVTSCRYCPTQRYIGVANQC